MTRDDLIEMKLPIGSRNRILSFIVYYKKHDG